MATSTMHVRQKENIAEPCEISWWLLTLCAVAVGVISGLGAVVFRAMIAVFHNFFFLGTWSFVYDATVHTSAAPWGASVIFAPAVGAVGVAFLVQTFAPEAKGHGVPEVIDAIYHKDGRIRPIVAVIKSVASALSIGSGGSVGREGPIIQVGAAFGSTLGQLIAMPARQRALLIAAGAGGGIAATFNTPIGGVAFAVELMLPSVTAMSLLCVALSSVIATSIGRMFFGVLPSFDAPLLSATQSHGVEFLLAPAVVAFGLLLGVLAWMLTRGIYWFEDLFDAMPGDYYTRHISGMLLVGALIYAFMKLSEPLFGQANHYYIEGVGYATIMDILRGHISAAGFLLLLVGAKLLVTCLTLGSGASGGVFSPAMFLGASFGGAFGVLAQSAFPDMPLTPAHFAYAGMAGMVGGTTGAVLTGVIMVFEMTRDYTVILPVIATVALSCAVRNALSPETIYSLKLVRRGETVPQGLQVRIMTGYACGDIMSRDFLLLMHESGCAPAMAREALQRGHRVVGLAPGGQICGVDEETLADPTKPSLIVDIEAPLEPLLRVMDDRKSCFAVVTRRTPQGGCEVAGVITEFEIARFTCAATRLLS